MRKEIRLPLTLTECAHQLEELYCYHPDCERVAVIVARKAATVLVGSCFEHLDLMREYVKEVKND